MQIYPKPLKAGDFVVVQGKGGLLTACECIRGVCQWLWFNDSIVNSSSDVELHVPGPIEVADRTREGVASLREGDVVWVTSAFSAEKATLVRDFEDGTLCVTDDDRGGMWAVRYPDGSPGLFLRGPIYVLSRAGAPTSDAQSARDKLISTIETLHDGDVIEINGDSTKRGRVIVSSNGGLKEVILDGTRTRMMLPTSPTVTHHQAIKSIEVIQKAHPGHWVNSDDQERLLHEKIDSLRDGDKVRVYSAYGSECVGNVVTDIAGVFIEYNDDDETFWCLRNDDGRLGHGTTNIEVIERAKPESELKPSRKESMILEAYDGTFGRLNPGMVRAILADYHKSEVEAGLTWDEATALLRVAINFVGQVHSQ